MGAIAHFWLSGAWLLAQPALIIRDINGAILHQNDLVSVQCKVVHVLQDTVIVRPLFPGQPMIGLNPLAVEKI